MNDAPRTRPLRADAKRNYDRILAAAETAFAEEGADASLEAIARRAGVGSATLHRHFASRQTLLEAVFHDRVIALCALAETVARDAAPQAALTAWLRALADYAATTRGLAASMVGTSEEPGGSHTGSTCQAMLAVAGGELLERARRTGHLRTGIAIEDLLTLVHAISLVTEQGGDRDEARRLLDITLEGIFEPSVRVTARRSDATGVKGALRSAIGLHRQEREGGRDDRTT